MMVGISSRDSESGGDRSSSSRVADEHDEKKVNELNKRYCQFLEYTKHHLAMLLLHC
jgi:hypothetical protein